MTIQHSVDVVRLLIFSYMKYKSHLTFFFFKLKKVSIIGFEPGQSDYRAGTLSTIHWATDDQLQECVKFWVYILTSI